MESKNITKNQQRWKFMQNYMNNFSEKFSDKIGNFFYRLGVVTATNPWITIFISICIVGFFSLGFLLFHNERNPLKLWVPQNSKFLRDTEWLMKSFEEGYREQLILVEAPNVLEPKYLKKITIINERITKFHIEKTNWENVCFKIPLIADYINENDDGKITKGQKRPFNPSVDLGSYIFCTIVNNLRIGCLQNNLVELWKYNEDIIDNLTLADVQYAVNKTKISPVTGHSMDVTHLLGGVQRNQSGYILSAKSLLSTWFLHVNFTQIDHNKIGNIAGTEDWASEVVLLWEQKFLDVITQLKKELDADDFTIYYAAGRSYGDISAKAMFQDLDKLMIGASLMFIFMQFVLSKLSWTELRINLACQGLLCVGMAFAASCGICSALGISYGPVHTSLPFLLMGLGVDDMFVMMACWRKVQQSNSHLPIPERLGLMLKHAGVSITVTSITDMVAFIIGATTILPSLQSFCTYAAIGVLMTYFLVVTFFVAVFSLDERRILAKRNAVLFCIIHDDSKAKPCMDLNLMHRSLKFIYTKFILTKPGKIIVIMTVICYTGFGIQSLLKLEQKFDPSWFIPESTYLSKFIMKKREFYPEMGFEAGIYFGKLNYSAEMTNLIGLAEKLNNRTDILHKINSWIEPFNEFVQIYYDKDFVTDNVTDKKWHYYLSKFLFSSDGGKYQANFRFKEKLKCGSPAPEINAAFIGFKFKKFEERSEYLPAMYMVKDMVKNMNLFTGDKFATVWGKIFGNWITDEIIDEEVYRNIGLALLCVMFCTGILIVNLQICFWIFICVLLTLINVGGYMQRWGLTIDLVTCIGLQLAVGLCVDYAAHIGHTFLTISQGTRTERALETVLQIGAAVLYGGGSTILALTMLAGSEAYTFQLFFKIFSLVIIFGLFHGIVFLPVVLSIIGPSPYHKCVSIELQDNNKDNGVGLKLNRKNGVHDDGDENYNDRKFKNETQPLNL